LSVLDFTPNGWIQTYTGRKFVVMDPDPECIVIEDIAHSLANQCRYAGHCLQFYSVAEHCYHLWALASPENKHVALMHDATEAYLVDVPRTVKEALGDYRPLEHKYAEIIAKRFNLEYPWPEEVHDLDNRILLDERAQNMPAFRNGKDNYLPAGYQWCKAEEDGWPFHKSPLNVQLQFWSPWEAEEKFLEAFYAR